METPNNNLCLFNGYKLSNIDTSSIRVSDGYIVIGGNEDDTGNEYRVQLTAMKDEEPGHCVEIDLEDVLAFVVRYCPSLYKKALLDAGLQF